MRFDTTTFTPAAPRLLIGPGERALVHDALHWNMPERRGEQPYDPVQALWGQRGQSPVDTEQFGFSLKELEQTQAALEFVVKNPEFTENPTTECQRALEIVNYAIGALYDQGA